MKILGKSSANLITILRIILVFTLLPLIYLTHYLTHSNPDGSIPNNLIFIIIFIFSALTDYLDGFIARKFKQQTLFGKCFDPIADKLLVVISFLYLYILSIKNFLIHQEEEKINPTVTIFIMAVLITSIFRDLLIMGIRILNAFEKNPTITSSFWGKSKTFITFISIIFLLCSRYLQSSFSLSASLITYLIIFCLIINIILIIVSGFEYILKYYRVVLKTF
ncbi:CDP-diacylglycerol--glycerol-3-phosphate 3-phosphatidyltransferase [Candidatus Phytoplasma phoenicium]|uniref:CDP-diacylglycerol--glycerol-3-phosphate 3-phosphatidyltransferase n=1 Tax=Candidatus Phytoplasma phoenicium TaxID=198422 RepID=A0A2S8NTF5_9MOLU|nr:CDP-diacylglycerol--glycerol-3-phosphate 3-phosphatidyltransferase [Candidatus Phytoplasma phoenicium]